MIVDSISALTPVSHRAIIINVSTKEVTTLAILSALRYSELPILLIDKESTDGSWEHFSRLFASEPRVNLCSAPFAKHGNTLDKIFRETRDDNLLLIDADLEICDSTIVNRMVDATALSDVFGAGAVHGPCWLGSAQNLPEKVAFYEERMWTPLTILKALYIKESLEEGYSFINRWVPNEICSVPWLSKALSKRFFVPVFKQVRAEFLRGTRRIYHDERPNLLCCDTGADIFCHLKYDRGASFIDFGIRNLESVAHHYHGVTRRRLNSRDRNAAAMDNIMGEVLRRLQTEYGIVF
jgi:hypothetical protein